MNLKQGELEERIEQYLSTLSGNQKIDAEIHLTNFLAWLYETD